MADLKIPISSIDDLKSSIQWFNDLQWRLFNEELREEQARGSLKDPQIYVDGRKDADPRTVKLFGDIKAVDKVGPVGAAIKLVDSIIMSAAPYKTGFYASASLWYLNGQEVGTPPTGEEVGAGGNAMVVNLATYASTLEALSAVGIFWLAYTSAQRTFGDTVAISWNYAQAKTFGDHVRRPGERGDLFATVPVITIGSPGSTVKPGILGAIPGKNRRRGKAKAKHPRWKK